MTENNDFFETQIAALSREFHDAPEESSDRWKITEKIVKRCVSEAALANSIEDRKRARAEIFQVLSQNNEDGSPLFDMKAQVYIVNRVMRKLSSGYAVSDALYGDDG